jgi:hypothetical protein
MKSYEASFDPKTGAVTYEGQEYTIQEWRLMVQREMVEYLRELNEARDITSDLTCLPGMKPFFYDDWLYTLPPRRRPKGYTFKLNDE